MQSRGSRPHNSGAKAMHKILKKFCCWMLVLPLVAASLAGCQTYGESTAAGALTGATLGGVIGHQSGNRDQGAVMGAILGGLLGLISHDVKVQQARGAQATADAYGYTPQSRQGEMLTLENAQVLPQAIQRGNRGEATIQYALLGTPRRGSPVRETRLLMHNGRTLAELSTRNFTRGDGTWVSTLQFDVPRDFEPGEYVILQRVQTAQSTISARTPFEVYD